MKSRRIFSMLLATVVPLCACGTPQARDGGGIPDDAAVASAGSHTVTWAQYRITFDTYRQYYLELGMDVLENESRLQGFQERTVDSLLQACVLADQAERQGFDRLSEEQSAELQKQIQNNIDTLGDAYQEQIAQELAVDPGLDVEAREKELIAAEAYYYTGREMEYDAYIDWISNYFREQFYVEQLKAATVAGVSVSEEELTAYYQQALEADQVTYTDAPQRYRQAWAASSGVPPLFAPEGYSRILVRTFPVDGLAENETYLDNLARMESLTQTYGAAAIAAALEGADNSGELSDLLDTYSQLQEETRQLMETLCAPVKADVDEAMALLDRGIAFEALLPEGEDRIQLISLRYTGEQDWSDAVKAAFSAMEPGTYSQPVLDEGGYHILYYIDDLPAGPLPLDLVREPLAASLLQSAQEDAWQAAIDHWMQDDSIKIDTDLMYAMGKTNVE